jgi:hypothetical protein
MWRFTVAMIGVVLASCSGGVGSADSGGIPDSPMADAPSVDASVWDARPPDAAIDAGAPLPDANGACTFPLADCNTSATDGCESNLNTDALDCGTCGHDCLGGSCMGGVCQPVLLASSILRVTGFALDDSYIYWTYRGTPSISFVDGEVRRMPLGGGPIETIASGQEQARVVRIAGDEVYWAYGVDGGVRYLSASSLGAPVTISGSGGPQYVADIAVDATEVYWTDSGTDVVDSGDHADGRIRHTPRGGGPVGDVVTGLQFPVFLAIASDEVYWWSYGTAATGYTDGTVLRAPKAGGSPELLLTPIDVYGIVADTANVWLTHAGTPAMSFTDGALYRIPFGGTPVIAASPRPRPWGVASDGTDAFWCDRGSVPTFDDGGVFTYDVSSSAISAIAPDALKPKLILVDANAVYWATLEPTELSDIYKVAR